MRPVIGITTYAERAAWGPWDTAAVVLHAEYVNALTDAGASVLLIPPLQRPTDYQNLLTRLDGLVLSGGPDIEPRRYGAQRGVHTDAPRADRDEAEIALARASHRQLLPTLGICRGMQIMAVAAGGTLTQDLPEAGYGQAHRSAPGAFVAHRASLDRDSLIAELLGQQQLYVQSSHHQAVDSPGSMSVSGRAEDGTVEVIEDPNRSRFYLGVQWHPEVGGDGWLFAGLVNSASRFARGESEALA